MNNPFGADVEKYWQKRHELFSKFDEGIQLDKEALFSVTPEAIAQDIAQKVQGKVVIDGFGCVGENSIWFAQYASKTYHIELDAQKLEMAKNNAFIYGVKDKIKFIQGNYFDIVPQLSANTVFLDPPWGGPDYFQKEQFDLEDFLPNGKDILELAQQQAPEAIFKLPKNFNIAQLQEYSQNLKIEDNYLNGKLKFKTAYL